MQVLMTAHACIGPSRTLRGEVAPWPNARDDRWERIVGNVRARTRQWTVSVGSSSAAVQFPERDFREFISELLATTPLELHAAVQQAAEAEAEKPGLESIRQTELVDVCLRRASALAGI
jgi:hypothetical protein